MMTNSTVTDERGPLERLAEHLLARPKQFNPDDTYGMADWLDYSLNRCGLVVIAEQALSRPHSPDEAMPFVIGDEVEVIPDCADWASDWQGQRLWVAGVQALAGGGFDYTVSDVWPIPDSAALTDQFYMGRSDEPDMLRIAMESARKKGETPCDHDWHYIGTDRRGSHKGEDAHKCHRCGKREYRQ